MRRKLADHDCWAKMPPPDIGNTRTLLGNAEPISTTGTPLLWKTAVPVPSASLGNLPYPETLPLVATGVKEIPPFLYYNLDYNYTGVYNTLMVLNWVLVFEEFSHGKVQF